MGSDRASTILISNHLVEETSAHSPIFEWQHDLAALNLRIFGSGGRKVFGPAVVIDGANDVDIELGSLASVIS